MKIAVIANSSWYLYNFRRSLLRALAAAGHEPVAVSPPGPHASKLLDEGFRHIQFQMQAAGTNPAREAAVVWRLHRLLRDGGYGAVFTYTPKANIYTGLAVRGTGASFVPNVSGLGRVFIARSWLTPVVATLYRMAFTAAHRVVFQNDDDRRAFLRLRLVRPDRALLVPGSGVDLQQFVPMVPAAKPADRVVILFVGRVLIDKGIGEFVEAARRIRARHPRVEFQVLGSLDSDNPAAVAHQTVERWVAEGVISYLGQTEDVRPVIGAADCVVLPSYREGVPRSLLEAAAMGKPCITTDAPGCRDAVDADVTGLVCKARCAASLTEAIETFLAMPEARRAEMGAQGRRKMERQFDERIVLSTYLGLAASMAPA